MRFLLRSVSFGALLALSLLPGSVAAGAEASVTIDFSAHGHGPFDASFYKADGVVFTEGTFVGYIQGDDALVGPAAGSFNRPATSLSAWVAPSIQGTAEYTLTAYGASGGVVATRSVAVTQDAGDPQTGPWGYVEIDLGALPRGAKSFRLENRFVRSSFSHVTSIPFGVKMIEYTRRVNDAQ